jgi:hypothetical protein
LDILIYVFLSFIFVGNSFPFFEYIVNWNL